MSTEATLLVQVGEIKAQLGEVARRLEPKHQAWWEHPMATSSGALLCAFLASWWTAHLTVRDAGVIKTAEAKAQQLVPAMLHAQALVYVIEASFEELCDDPNTNGDEKHSKEADERATLLLKLINDPVLPASVLGTMREFSDYVAAQRLKFSVNSPPENQIRATAKTKAQSLHLAIDKSLEALAER